MSSPTSNEDLIAELEAAASKWVLEKNKYTLECLRDARAAALRRMSAEPSAVETSARPTCHYAGPCDYQQPKAGTEGPHCETCTCAAPSPEKASAKCNCGELGAKLTGHFESCPMYSAQNGGEKQP